MPGKGCGKGPHRKHTPLVSKKQRGLFGAAYGAKKKRKKKPGYVPSSLWNQPMKTLRMHLKESKGKKLLRRKKR